MAKKKIYKHHQRSTIAQALADAQTREIVLGSGERQAGLTFADGNKLVLNNYFDVKAFGATGDGITHDRPSIDLALAAISAAGGGVLFFPSGTYRISSPLVIPSNTLVVGRGASTIIKSTSHTVWGSKGMFRFSNVSNSGIRDLVIDGDLANQTLSGMGGGVDEGGSAGIEIGNGAHGLVFSNVISQNHQGNTIGNFGDGFYLGDDMNDIDGNAVPYDVRFYNCTAINNRRQGLSGIAGYDIKFYGCRFADTIGDNPGGGVDLEPDASFSAFRDWLFQGCVFEGNAYGIILNNAQQSTWRNIRLHGCTMRRNRFDGVQVQENSEGTTEIVSCDIVDNYRHGIFYTASSNRAVKVIGGSIINNYGYGIDVAEGGSRFLDFIGVHIFLNSLDGMRVGHVTGGNLGNSVLSCKILNNGAGDISAAGAYDGIAYRGNSTHTEFTSSISRNLIGNDSDISGFYDWAQLNFDASGYVGCGYTITLNSSGYTNCVPSDVGKTVNCARSGAAGTLVSYDNSTRQWVITQSSGPIPWTSDSATISAGTGAGNVVSLTSDHGKKVTGGTSGAVGALKGWDNANRKWLIETVSGVFADAETVTLESWSETPVAGIGTGTLNDSLADSIYVNADSGTFSLSSPSAGLSPRRFVGDESEAEQAVVKVTSTNNSTLYRVVINGVNHDYTSDGSATTAEILAGLVAAINGGAQPVTAAVAADSSYILGATTRNGVYLHSDCVGVDISDNNFLDCINEEIIDTDGNSRKRGNLRDRNEMNPLGVRTFTPDADLHVVAADGTTTARFEIGPAVGASRKSLRVEWRGSQDAASIWPLHTGTGNLPMEIGGSRIRLATSANGNVQDHSSNVRLDVQDSVVDVTTGNLSISTAGMGIKIKEGSNARMGTATLVGGTVTVSNTSVTANTRIFLTIQSLGTVTAPKAIGVTARTASTSFTITSADATDTSVIAWQLVEPA